MHIAYIYFFFIPELIHIHLYDRLGSYFLLVYIEKGHMYNV